VQNITIFELFSPASEIIDLR